MVASAGVEPTDDHLARAEQYLARARRACWFGLVCGLVAGVGPLAGEEGGSLVVPRMIAGYLFGVLLSELFPPPVGRGQVRSASLRPRSASDLVPRFALVLPWVALVPVLATPLLLLGSHPRGATAFTSVQGACFGTAYWPHAATLIAIAALAAAGLVLVLLALRRATQRPQPAEDLPTWQLDRALRARSARAAVASATALGLTLLAVVAEYIDRGIHSYVCSCGFETFGGGGNVYSWGDAIDPWLQHASLILIISAIAVWIICGRLRLPSRDQRTA